MKEAFEKQEMTSLMTCMNTMQKRGYTENFLVNDSGLFSADSEKNYLPEEVQIVDYYRFEGETDPGDSSILYVIETSDGAKGLLSDAYGAYADPKVSRFMDEVDARLKKQNSDR
jgi:predicted RND superfamily exporter protein